MPQKYVKQRPVYHLKHIVRFITGGTPLQNVLVITGGTPLQNVLVITGGTPLQNVLVITGGTPLQNVLVITGGTPLQNVLVITGGTPLNTQHTKQTDTLTEQHKTYKDITSHSLLLMSKRLYNKVKITIHKVLTN